MAVPTSNISLAHIYYEIYGVWPSAGYGVGLEFLVQQSNLTDKTRPHSISQFSGYTHFVRNTPVITMPLQPLTYESTWDVDVTWRFSMSPAPNTNTYISVEDTIGGESGFYTGTGSTTVSMNMMYIKQPSGYRVDMYLNPGSYYSLGSDTSAYVLIPADGSGGGGDCFVAGTMITLADGTTLDVAEIRPGAVVKSYDLQGLDRDNESKEYVLGWRQSELAYNNADAMIINMKRSVASEFVNINNGALVSTFGHGHFVYDGAEYRFKNAKDVVVGDSLVKSDGTLELVTSVEFEYGERDIYKIDVEDYDLYTANGYITHNPVIKPAD